MVEPMKARRLMLGTGVGSAVELRERMERQRGGPIEQHAHPKISCILLRNLISLPPSKGRTLLRLATLGER